MAVLNVSDFYLNFDNSSSYDPSFNVPYTTIANGINWNDPPIDQHTSITPWIVGLLQMVAQHLVDNPDTDPQLFVGLPNKTIGTATNGTTFVEYSYEVTVRVIDPTGNKPDGDTLWQAT